VARRPRRPGAGSWRVLGWVSRLGVGGVEPAQWALRLSRPVVYSHIARLVDAGLLARVVVGDGGGGVVAVTPRGARVAQDRGVEGVVRASPVAASTGRHARAVAWVAASAELRGWRWLGPAGLRADRGWMIDPRGHAPDLGLVRATGRTAVEVELHAKSKARLRAILGAYGELIEAGQLAGVAYVSDRRDVPALIAREAERAMLTGHLHVGPLQAIVDDVRVRGVAARHAARAGLERDGGGGESWSLGASTHRRGGQLALRLNEVADER
jgi:hypothetical protein